MEDTKSQMSITFMVQNYYSLWYFITPPICDNKEDVSQNRIKSLIFFLKMVLFFNGLVLKIDSINLFHAIHHWKEESHSFPTVCGNLMENFFSYNTSGANRCMKWKSNKKSVVSLVSAISVHSRSERMCLIPIKRSFWDDFAQISPLTLPGWLWRVHGG